MNALLQEHLPTMTTYRIDMMCGTSLSCQNRSWFHKINFNNFIRKLFCTQRWPLGWTYHITLGEKKVL